MRDYGKVHTAFWSSEAVRSLSDDGRMLALYLLTCQHGTLVGAFRLPDGYVCEDLQWSQKRLHTSLAELQAIGFAIRCDVSKWLWVVKHLEWNPLENPNQRKAAAKIALQIPDSCTWKHSFLCCNAAMLSMEMPEKTVPDEVSEPLGNPSRTLAESVTVAVTVKESISGGGDLPARRFDDFWGSWPKNDRKQDKGKCAEKWRLEKLDEICDTILRDVQAKKKTKKWRDGFVEAPLVYLNRRRWEDTDESDSSLPDAVDWFSAAGFDDESEARNFGCTPSNAHLYANGQKQEIAA